MKPQSTLVKLQLYLRRNVLVYLFILIKFILYFTNSLMYLRLYVSLTSKKKILKTINHRREHKIFMLLIRPKATREQT